jgi:hypothetical protein
VKASCSAPMVTPPTPYLRRRKTTACESQAGPAGLEPATYRLGKRVLYPTDNELQAIKKRQPESHRPDALCRRAPICSVMPPRPRQESNLRPSTFGGWCPSTRPRGQGSAPGWIRTTAPEGPGLQPGAIAHSATDAWGADRESNPVDPGSQPGPATIWVPAPVASEGIGPPSRGCGPRALPLS